MTLSEALDALLVQGHINAIDAMAPMSWALPGMAFVTPAGAVRRLDARDLTLPEPHYELALKDPATVGCLLARLREAAGEPTIAAVFRRDRWELQFWDPEVEDLDAWQPNYPYVETGETEAAAIVAGLIAFAEAL